MASRGLGVGWEGMGFGSFTGFAIDFRRADRLIAHTDRPLLRTFLLEGVSEDREICE